MKYPETFVQKVKATYPNFAQMHAALDAGSEMVGRYLDDSRTSVTYDTIMSAHTLEWLQDRVQEAIRREALYREWFELVHQMQKQP